MADIRKLLPPLTLNRRLLQLVLDDPRPAFALGFVEERRQALPLLLLSLPEVDDLNLLGEGFDLGYQTSAGPGGRAVRLDFNFAGLCPLQVVIDAEAGTAQRVLTAMASSAAYFVLVLGYQGARAFKSNTGAIERACMDELLGKLAPKGGARSFAGLKRALLTRRDGEELHWVAHEDVSLLDLNGLDRHELRPAR